MNKWIPISKRLPDNCDNVLVTYEIDLLGEIMVGVAEADYIMGDWIPKSKIPGLGKVIAWMPLPEPYKEEAE